MSSPHMLRPFLLVEGQVIQPFQQTDGVDGEAVAGYNLTLGTTTSTRRRGMTTYNPNYTFALAGQRNTSSLCFIIPLAAESQNQSILALNQQRASQICSQSLQKKLKKKSFTT